MTLSARKHRSRAFAFCASFVGVALLTVACIAYMLQSRWPQAPAVDAPPLPILVAGVVFDIPPAAIRLDMQRHAGTQERLDLAYQWPELIPLVPKKAAPTLFVTIQASRLTLTPAERLQSVYPRYIGDAAKADPGGLTVAHFRDRTPYQGEDLLYDSSAPGDFALRCSRGRGDIVRPVCLYERLAGAAALTFRFPRQWLADWRTVESGIDHVIESWRPGNGLGQHAVKQDLL
jgi:hypothetical protein